MSASHLSPQANADLDDIWYYTATVSGSIEIADQLIDSITSRFATCARYPHIGRDRSLELRAGLRTFPVDRYVIIYRIDGEGVLILRVIRGNRDITSLFGP
jgi:toxin ParE1/3/4